MTVGSSSALGCAAPLRHLHFTAGDRSGKFVNNGLNHLELLATMPSDPVDEEPL